VVKLKKNKFSNRS